MRELCGKESGIGQFVLKQLVGDLDFEQLVGGLDFEHRVWSCVDPRQAKAQRQDEASNQVEAPRGQEAQTLATETLKPVAG